MIGDRLGIGHDPRQHAVYVQRWIKALQHDPGGGILRAAREIDKITDHVLAFEKDRPAQKIDELQPIAQPAPTRTAFARRARAGCER